MISASRSGLRRLRRLVNPGRHWDRWVPAPTNASPPASAAAWCVICRWHGEQFSGIEHCESAVCPRCDSIARDRFLFASLASRPVGSTGGRKPRVLETSPRMGPAYRHAMNRWFRYTCSDLDERAHKGQVRIDLQRIDLPDDSFDAVLSSHVLEHVPNTGDALGELRRIIRPGGALYLQVPVLQGRTGTPSTPEFHGDDTPVHWRFGWDLLDRLDAAGFTSTALVPATFPTAGEDPGPRSAEFDVDDIIDHVPHDRLRRIGTVRSAEQLGWRPAYMFVTFEAINPDRTTLRQH